ncbi:NlpC/P60 family protein [Fodinicola acaciae]|uniref:C40 family peptidase n=1 Tax=Fodinicola acaciae TaxID=2681555 RepID=UPI0013D01B32|nr:C40 family peptidase [Fodinicola acaciae]
MTRARALSRRKHALFIPIVTASLLASLVSTTPASAAPTQPDIGQVNAQIQALTQKLNTANEQYNTANVQLTKVKAQQATLGKQLAATQAQIAILQQQAGSYAVSAYKGGDMSMMTSMMTSGSADQFLQQMTTLDALTAKAAAPLLQLRAAKKALDAQNAKLQALSTSATNLVTTLAASKQSFNAQLQPLMALQAKLSPNYDEGTTHAVAPPGSSPEVRFAFAQLGEPYVFGAAGPDSWDCSGLTMMAYQQEGISLDHSAHMQYAALKHVSRSQVQAGDLVFFYDFEHVGIAISNKQVIHAPQPGESVKISNIDIMPFAGAARG